MTVTIWHNPRCSKSRQTLKLLEDRGLSPQIRLYLKDSPSAAEIKAVLDLLRINPIDLMRTGEKVFREARLTKSTDPARLIDAMAEHPILIERPVVLAYGRAALGRPPEAVLDIL